MTYWHDGEPILKMPGLVCSWSLLSICTLLGWSPSEELPRFPACRVGILRARWLHRGSCAIIPVSTSTPIWNGPACPSGRVAAVEGAGEEHVLGADQDGGSFWVEVPFALFLGEVFAAHEDHGRMRLRQFAADGRWQIRHLRGGKFLGSPRAKAD